MRVLVSGSSGLVGRALCASLAKRGDDVWSLVRRPARPGGSEIEWPAPAPPPDASQLEGFDAVVHLAGESIASGLWTERRRRVLRSSRVDATQALMAPLVRCARPPSMVVCAAAVGAYGDSGDQPVDEDSPRGEGFLADLVRDWEHATDEASAAGIRVVNARIGIVLTPDGGALARMLPAFRWGLGARLGNGRQWMSWITLRDLVSAVEFLIATDGLAGPVNLVGGADTNGAFTKALGRAVGRPAPWVAPAPLLRLVAGDFAKEALLGGQRVRSRRLSDAGFEFRDGELESALRGVIREGRPGTAGPSPGGES